jgi:hypothetical protein
MPNAAGRDNVTGEACLRRPRVGVLFTAEPQISHRETPAASFDPHTEQTLGADAVLFLLSLILVFVPFIQAEPLYQYGRQHPNNYQGRCF